MKRALTTVGVAAVLALTACSSTTKSVGQPVSVSVPTVSAIVASTSPSPTPTEWSTAVAQANYLSYVAPGNADIDVLNKATSQTVPSLAAVTAACAKLVVSTDTLARQINAGLWPASAKTAAAALVVSLTQERGVYQSCAAATTISGSASALSNFKDTGTAEAMRIALGLPGNS